MPSSAKTFSPAVLTTARYEALSNLCCMVVVLVVMFVGCRRPSVGHKAGATGVSGFRPRHELQRQLGRPQAAWTLDKGFLVRSP